MGSGDVLREDKEDKETLPWCFSLLVKKESNKRFTKIGERKKIYISRAELSFH